jgi:ribosomal protein S18 acetylase RimI-like enzyme/predicted nucleic acid-binding protein
MNIEILAGSDSVAAFVDQAQLAADSEKDALGFLPERAFKEAADQGKLLVALVRQGDVAVYAGHLMHGGVFPQARIFQVYTAPQFRRNGIARRLVEAIVRKAESMQFMSVLAQVADDLEANRFWENVGFETIRTRPGGHTKRRKINVRIRELSTPHLFSIASAQKEQPAQDLRLVSRLYDVSPIYVLDLNVLFDLLKRRANAEEVGRIIHASFSNVIRLAITEEFVRELERTSQPAPTDPILELARRLPRLKAPPQEVLTEIISRLGRQLFPFAISSGNLRVQDQSDLVHLATAIHHKASGFITSEKIILKGRAVLQTSYGLDVLGAGEFADTVEPPDSNQPLDISVSSTGGDLQGRPTQQHETGLIAGFLTQMRCPQQLAGDAIRTDPGRPNRKLVVTSGGAVVAFASWDIPSSIHYYVRAFLCANEDHWAAGMAVEFLLDSISREAQAGAPIQIGLRILPGHVTTRRVATAHGFRPSADEHLQSTDLQKIALGIVVTANNWSSICGRLKSGMNIGLPAAAPVYQSPTQTVRIESPAGQTLGLPLNEVETLLSPTIFVLPGRPGAIVPIRRVHAADLVGGSKQLALLAAPEAVLLRERVYFSHPRTAGVLTSGTALLFYESARKGGRASVIAAARIVRTELMSKDRANHELLRRGVLDKKILKNICLADSVIATTIDNIMLFERPVGLERLRCLGAIDGANLVTARPLKPDQMIQIIEEGMLNDAN